MISSFDLVVAMDQRRGIGVAGQLPWKLSGDLKYFKELTSKVSSPGKTNAIIMGRKTWESIPSKRRPLPDRVNVVITRDSGYVVPEGVLVASSLDQSLETLQRFQLDRCFVIGGGEVYRLALDHPCCQTIYLTEVRSTFDCDTFFPEFGHNFVQVSSSNWQQEDGIEYAFKEFKRSPP